MRLLAKALGAIFFALHTLEQFHAYQAPICPPAPGKNCPRGTGRRADRGGGGGGGGALAQAVIDPVNVDTFLLNHAVPTGTTPHFVASGFANTQAENYGTAFPGNTPVSLFHLYTYLDNSLNPNQIGSAVLTIDGLPPNLPVYCRIEGDLINNPNAYGWTGGCQAMGGGNTAINVSATGTLTVNFALLPLNPIPAGLATKIGIRLFAQIPGHYYSGTPVMPTNVAFQYSAAITGVVATDPIFNPTFTIPAYHLAGPVGSGSINSATNTATIPFTFTNPGTGPATGISYTTSFTTAPPAGTTFNCAPGCSWNGATGAVTFAPAVALAAGASHTVTLSYTAPAGSNLTPTDITILANSGTLPTAMAPSATGPGRLGSVMPLAFAAGGAASVPATGALALGGMAALVALTPMLAARRRRRNNP